MRRARLLLALLASAALAQAAQEPTYDLVWKPRADQTLRYRLTMDMDRAGESVGFDWDVQAKVLKIEANGDYEVETTFGNGKMRLRGESYPFDEGDQKDVARFNAKGEQISPKKADEEDEDDTLGELLGTMTDFTQPERPVKKGDKWSKEIEADRAKDISAARLEYELAGTEKSGDFDAVRVNYTYRELTGDKPATAKGYFLIDAKDGSPIAFETNAENLRLGRDMAEARGTATLKMVRQ